MNQLKFNLKLEGMPENIVNAMKVIREATEIFVLMSKATRQPFVECDEETFDDQVYVFSEQQLAVTKAKMLEDTGDHVDIIKLPVHVRIGFVNSLYALGVNAIMFDLGTKAQACVQLEELIVRPDIPRYSEETKLALMKKKTGNSAPFRVENPELHLTALYFMQLLKNAYSSDRVEEMKELHTEMLAHFSKGYFIAVRSADGKIPTMKAQEGDCLQPLFTDLNEVTKFQRANKNVKLQTAVVSYNEFVQKKDKNITGVLLNPTGVGIIFRFNDKPPMA